MGGVAQRKGLTSFLTRYEIWSGSGSSPGNPIGVVGRPAKFNSRAVIVRLAPSVGDNSAAFASLVEAVFDAITGSR